MAKKQCMVKKTFCRAVKKCQCDVQSQLLILKIWICLILSSSKNINPGLDFLLLTFLDNLNFWKALFFKCNAWRNVYLQNTRISFEDLCWCLAANIHYDPLMMSQKVAPVACLVWVTDSMRISNDVCFLVLPFTKGKWYYQLYISQTQSTIFFTFNSKFARIIN